MSKAIVLWTGGKDSALALHESVTAGVAIASLVTFAPENPNFLAHPIPFMRYQARALEIQHQIKTLAEPSKAAYIEILADLQKELGITCIITGDIAELDGHPNWILDCAESLGMQVIRPLWQQDRLAVLQRCLDLDFEIIFSCVKNPWFIDPAWLGKKITQTVLQDLQALHQTNGLDICGENGEYHSMVLNSPQFKTRLHLTQFSPATQGSLMYMQDQRYTLSPKS